MCLLEKGIKTRDKTRFTLTKNTWVLSRRANGSRISGMYLGSCQTSIMETFVKIVNPFIHNVIKWPNIL